MLKIYNCVATAHDLRLVGLAAVICTLASLAAINLLRHARQSAGRMQESLARGLGDLYRLRDLGHAFHRDAGFFSGHSEWL